MKWAGLLPGALLWESSSIAEVAKKFFNENKPLQRPLDAIIEKLIDCQNATQVVVKLEGAFARLMENQRPSG